MTFEQFKKGIKAIPLSTWKKIFVPIICIFTGIGFLLYYSVPLLDVLIAFLCVVVMILFYGMVLDLIGKAANL